MHINRGKLRVDMKVGNKLNSSDDKMTVPSRLTNGSKANSVITVLNFKIAYFRLYRVR